MSGDGRTIRTDAGVGIPKFCCGAAVFDAANSANNLTPGVTTPQGLPTLAADPVDLSTGIFMLSATDYVLPGRTPPVGGQQRRGVRAGDDDGV